MSWLSEFETRKEKQEAEFWPIFPQIKDIKQKEPHMWFVICSQVFGAQAVDAYLEYIGEQRKDENQR